MSALRRYYYIYDQISVELVPAVCEWCLSRSLNHVLINQLGAYPRITDFLSHMLILFHTQKLPIPDTYISTFKVWLTLFHWPLIAHLIFWPYWWVVLYLLSDPWVFIVGVQEDAMNFVIGWAPYLFFEHISGNIAPLLAFTMVLHVQ